MNSNRHKEGFSLIEILVVAMIFVTIIGIVFTFFRSGTMVFAAGEDRVDIQKELRLAMEFMRDDLRQANGDSIIILDEGATISFSMSTGVVNGYVVWGLPVSYSIAEGQLTRTQNGYSIPVAENITAVTFSRVGSRKIAVELTGLSDSLTFQAQVRNSIDL